MKTIVTFVAESDEDRAELEGKDRAEWDISAGHYTISVSRD